MLTTTIADTEIDWTAYMEQVSQILSGERDYTKIRGGTGPLVYPAAHVYIYTGLYHLTDEGRNIFFAQQLFAGLYMLTLGVVMGCYRQAKVNELSSTSVVLRQTRLDLDERQKLTDYRKNRHHHTSSRS